MHHHSKSKPKMAVIRCLKCDDQILVHNCGPALEKAQQFIRRPCGENDCGGRRVLATPSHLLNWNRTDLDRG